MWPDRLYRGPHRRGRQATGSTEGTEGQEGDQEAHQHQVTDADAALQGRPIRCRPCTGRTVGFLIVIPGDSPTLTLRLPTTGWVTAPSESPNRKHGRNLRGLCFIPTPGRLLRCPEGKHWLEVSHADLMDAVISDPTGPVVWVTPLPYGTAVIEGQ